MRAIAEFTCSSVCAMSTLQSKDKSTSAEPRLVVERTSSRPGTLFTASSIGRVIVTSIWSMGITPLSTPMMIRGKLVDGKTAIGNRKRFVDADSRQNQDQKDDRLGVAGEPVARAISLAAWSRARR